MSVAPRGYEALSALARDRRLRIADLLLQSPSADPFYCGMPAQVAAAEWFADLWQRFNFTDGIHLRRVHYRIVSQREVPPLPDGAPYLNTEQCWKALGLAGKYARYLGLVAPHAFEDRRNPPPRVNEPGAAEIEPPSFQHEDPYWQLPSIDGEINHHFGLRLPRIDVRGYEELPSDQPYQLEIWVEKSTVDDVLEPLCHTLAANYVTAVGNQSITSVVKLLSRVARTEKPTRIFYFSDFDPAGDNMPSSVSRQVEFWLSEYAPGADIKLTALVLTAAQVSHYDLPRIPIKDSDGRKDAFQQRHGEGAVELDALEALHPGEIARIAREALAPYRDDELGRRLRRSRHEAHIRADRAWTIAMQPVTAALADIEDEASTIARSYAQELANLQQRLAAELQPLQERLDELTGIIEERAAAVCVDLPERPQAAPIGSDESGWLFASERDYLEQLAAYRERKQLVRLDFIQGFTRMCDVCGTDISTRSRKARTCSPSCNNKRYLARAKAQVAS